MSLGYSICEEFSDEVYRLHKFNILQPHVSEATEELKCSVEIKHFTVLVERMVQAGYCCTQVQKDHEKNTCTAWFEPMSMG